jgi:hypothetical protein
MKIRSNKEARQVIALVDALEGQPATGSAILKISSASGVDISSAHRLLTKHDDYFSRVNDQDSMYSISNSSTFQSNCDLIRQDVHNQIEKLKRSQYALIIVFVCIVVLS